MKTELGPHFEKNLKRLSALPNPDEEWEVALRKCRRLIQKRLYRRTLVGAHCGARLGEDALDYYTSFAYEAILSGTWEWKDDHSLSDQMCRIANSAISNEVEKATTARINEEPVVLNCDQIEILLYEQDLPPDEIKSSDLLIIDMKITAIEDAIQGDSDCELFWDCIKEGMKPAEIATFMEKTAKQVYKLRDRFIEKVKSSAYLEI